jgi:hypothetical protein
VRNPTWLGLVGILIGALLCMLVTDWLVAACSTSTPAPEFAAPTAAAVPEELPLIEHATKSIDVSAPRISAGRKAILATLVTHVAEKVFADRRHQEFWIALVGVESRYESAARSPVGAVGLGQLMPQYASEFARTCGLPEIAKEDIQDDYTNLMLSACLFKTLIETNSGSVPLALTSYNAGGRRAAEAAKGGKIPQETDAYVRKIWIKRDQTVAN